MMPIILKYTQIMNFRIIRYFTNNKVFKFSFNVLHFYFRNILQSAESGLVKIKNISAASNEQNLLTNIRCASAELLQPLILGCSSKNARLVQVSLQAIQKMVQHRVIESVRSRFMCFLAFI